MTSDLTARVVVPAPSSTLRDFVEKHSGQRVRDCIQCGKCTAGCPSSYAMDLGPRRVIRAVQLGMEAEALGSTAIWLCLSCYTCSARCPAQIDIAKVMESLRHLASARHIKPSEKDIALFHKLFLNNINRFGHVYELGLGANFNIAGRHPFANVGLFPAMLKRGKLPILPHRVKATSEVKAIFKKVKAIEAEGKR